MTTVVSVDLVASCWFFWLLSVGWLPRLDFIFHMGRPPFSEQRFLMLRSASIWYKRGFTNLGLAFAPPTFRHISTVGTHRCSTASHCKMELFNALSRGSFFDRFRFFRLDSSSHVVSVSSVVGSTPASFAELNSGFSSVMGYLFSIFL